MLLTIESAKMAAPRPIGTVSAWGFDADWVIAAFDAEANGPQAGNQGE